MATFIMAFKTASFIYFLQSIATWFIQNVHLSSITATSQFPENVCDIKSAYFSVIFVRF